MKKIEIKICVGTTCFIMGGADLFDKLFDDLPPELLENVQISLNHCLGACSTGQHGLSPYVLVGQTLIAQADFCTIESEIIKQLGGK